jgi:hypothetical protein
MGFHILWQYFENKIQIKITGENDNIFWALYTDNFVLVYF